MFRFDRVGQSSIRIDDAPSHAVHALLDACTLPIIVHDLNRAAVLGTATLVRHGAQVHLLTAAHVLDHSLFRLGNVLVTEHGHAQGGARLVALHGAQVRRALCADVALIELTHCAALPAIVRGRIAVPLREAIDEASETAHDAQAASCDDVFAVCGFPAAWSRFERGWLAARHLTVFTQRHHTPSASGHCCSYRRTAHRADGEAIHTPALDGMSGAGIWHLHQMASGALTAQLTAVQSAFVHSQYLRGDDVAHATPLLVQ
ncbi:MAG: hypothetical protein ACRCV9_09045 [Burkholderiaceae bacterium]